MRALEGAPRPIRMVALSPDGRHALSAGPESIIRYWDLESGQLLRGLEGHADLVTGLAFSRDGSRAFSCSLDKTLRTWRLPQSKARALAPAVPSNPKVSAGSIEK